MALITLQGQTIETTGTIPTPGTQAANFSLVSSDLKEYILDDFQDKIKVLNVFPSIDTPVCEKATRTFIQELSKQNVYLLNISADLPFALQRFCQAEELNENQHVLSCFRSTFSQDYHVMMASGPLRGLCARAVFVLSKNDEILYTELVSELSHEPNYAQALDTILNKT